MSTNIVVTYRLPANASDEYIGWLRDCDRDGDYGGVLEFIADRNLNPIDIEVKW